MKPAELKAWAAYQAATAAFNADPSAANRERMAAALRRLSLAMGGSEADAIAACAHLDATLAREAGMRPAIGRAA